jgi:hypothetical protein
MTPMQIPTQNASCVLIVSSTPLAAAIVVGVVKCTMGYALAVPLPLPLLLELLVPMI